MKKTKVFFMTLLVCITLIGFSGTSLAFDLSTITEKPVKFAKYIAKKLGFGDDDEEKTPKAEPANDLTIQESTELTDNSENKTKPIYYNLSEIDISSPLASDEFGKANSWQGYREKSNLTYGEDWYFKIDSRAGDIFLPFSYKSPNTSVLQTKVKYSSELPWETFSEISTEFFLESAFSRQQVSGPEGMYPEDINEVFSLGSDNMDYGIRVNALVKDAKIGFYGWYGNDLNPLSHTFLLETQDITSESLWRAMNSGYYVWSNNLAATVTYELPFMRFFHQGMSPTVRFETAYRSTANKPEYSGINEVYDQWKLGMAYEGNNRVEWLNTYGINWGVGYNYTVSLDDMGTEDNSKKGYGSHSGNISANTYWFNMKLYTMFMYYYDRETRGSMTVLNATYSPDLRWSYGIRANFYNGKIDIDHKELNDNKELVTFTATYRWD